MKKEIIYLLLLSLVSCSNSPTIEPSIENESIKNSYEDNSSSVENESIEISSSEEIIDLELIQYKNIILEELEDFVAYFNLSKLDETLKENVINKHKQCVEQINTLDNISSIKDAYENAKKELANVIPLANGEYDYTSLSIQEKTEISGLLLSYAMQNNFAGIGLAESSDGLSYINLNLNSTSTEDWEELFGENGIVCQTNKEEYYEVKPILSNEFFIKGLLHSINRYEFALNDDGLDQAQISPITSKTGYMLTSGYSILDTENYKNYLNTFSLDENNDIYSVEKARDYFKFAIKELEENNIYTPGSKDNPTIIEFEIAYMYESQKNRFHDFIKESIEEIFNDEYVTNGNYILNITYYVGKTWDETIRLKQYVGKFDLGIGSIGLSAMMEYYHFLSLSTNTNISRWSTVNFSFNTNRVDKGILIYNNERYSYDALLSAAIGNAKIENGSLIENEEVD